MSCHSQEKSVIVATSLKDTTKHTSYIYNLKYDEANPRKSQLITKSIQSTVKGLFPFSSPHNQFALLQQLTSQGYRLNKLPYQYFEQGKEAAIQQMCVLPQEIKTIIFPKNESKGFMCGRNTIWAIDVANIAQNIQVCSSVQDITHCTMDPIHNLLTYATVGGEIRILDKSMKKSQFSISTGGAQEITAIDYNPTKQYGLLSAHPECIKFWDVRRSAMPVKCLENHHGLIMDAAYNHSHDELLVCSYDDGSACLYRATSVSSARAEDSQDALVKTYDEHEDSVYTVKWAPFSPWLFFTLSYHATILVANLVPSVEKYRILL